MHHNPTAYRKTRRNCIFEANKVVIFPKRKGASPFGTPIEGQAPSFETLMRPQENEIGVVNQGIGGLLMRPYIYLNFKCLADLHKYH